MGLIVYQQVSSKPCIHSILSSVAGTISSNLVTLLSVVFVVISCTMNEWEKITLLPWLLLNHIFLIKVRNFEIESVKLIIGEFPSIFLFNFLFFSPCFLFLCFEASPKRTFCIVYKDWLLLDIYERKALLYRR